MEGWLVKCGMSEERAEAPQRQNQPLDLSRCSDCRELRREVKEVKEHLQFLIAQFTAFSNNWLEWQQFQRCLNEQRSAIDSDLNEEEDEAASESLPPPQPVQSSAISTGRETNAASPLSPSPRSPSFSRTSSEDSAPPLDSTPLDGQTNKDQASTEDTANGMASAVEAARKRSKPETASVESSSNKQAKSETPLSMATPVTTGAFNPLYVSNYLLWQANSQALLAGLHAGGHSKSAFMGGLLPGSTMVAASRLPTGLEAPDYASIAPPSAHPYTVPKPNLSPFIAASLNCIGNGIRHATEPAIDVLQRKVE